jgi:cell division protein FtsI (penicillin-binding protein 3)
MIDEPSAGQHYGGAVAAPVFSQVMGASLRTLGIAPDSPLQVADATGGKGRL